MITPTQTKKIKAALGKHYTGKILAVLNDKGIVNTNNEPYKSPSIMNIVKGKQEVLPIEKIIIALAAKETRRKKTETERRKKLLK